VESKTVILYKEKKTTKINMEAGWHSMNQAGHTDIGC
jgi:hypothetical protein